MTSTLPHESAGSRGVPAAIEALVTAALAAPDSADGVGPAIAVGLLWPDGQHTVAVWGHRARWALAADRPGQRRLLHESERQPVALGTHFDLASLTKPMATVTLWAHALSAREPEDAAALLGRPLRTWLPDASGERLGDATLAQALGHATGMPAWHDFAADHPADPAAFRRAVLQTAAEHPEGARAVYSDLGYLALGWALEHLSGVSLDVLFAEQVAQPLGLAATFRPCGTRSITRQRCVATELWQRAGTDALALIDGEVHDDNAWALGGVAGHAGLFAPVGDVVRWARCWLVAARGEQSADPRLAPAVVQSLLRQRAAPGTSWRLGWDTPSGPRSTAGTRAGPRTFGHLGFTGTSVWLDPERGAGVVLLTARVHPARASISGIRALRPSLADAAWAAFDAPPAP